MPQQRTPRLPDFLGKLAPGQLFMAIQRFSFSDSNEGRGILTAVRKNVFGVVELVALEERRHLGYWLGIVVRFDDTLWQWRDDLQIRMDVDPEVVRLLHSPSLQLVAVPQIQFETFINMTAVPVHRVVRNG